MFFERKIRWYKLFETVEEANANLPVGAVTTILVNRKKICLAHTSEGFFAVNDKCPHNGASLGNGYCTAEGAVVCPLHRYRFDLKTGRAKSGVGDFVQNYPIEIRNNGVFVGFSEIVWNLF
jgi:3-phenylpropionate/trans-cinnamate dioxygenase ferredoxin subunit